MANFRIQFNTFKTNGNTYPIAILIIIVFVLHCGIYPIRWSLMIVDRNLQLNEPMYICMNQRTRKAEQFVCLHFQSSPLMRGKSVTSIHSDMTDTTQTNETFVSVRDKSIPGFPCMPRPGRCMQWIAGAHSTVQERARRSLNFEGHLFCWNAW